MSANLQKNVFNVWTCFLALTSERFKYLNSVLSIVKQLKASGVPPTFIPYWFALPFDDGETKSFIVFESHANEMRYLKGKLK